MRDKLLIGVAAVALIAGAGIASAQTKIPQGDEKAPGATPPPAAIQNAPAEKVGEPIQKSQERVTTGQNAPQMKNPANAQAPAGKAATDAEIKAKAAGDTDMKAKGKAASDAEKASGKAATDNKASGSTTVSGDNKAKADTKTNAASDSKATTGQGSAATAANLSAEQRTKITTVIREQKVKPVTNVNFSISIGTHVPRSVHFYPLPAPVVAIYPAWRGYKFILVGDEIVVIHPDTFAIVAVLPA